jgi:hypothetical protein
MLRRRCPVFSAYHPSWYRTSYSRSHDDSSPRGVESQWSCLGNTQVSVRPMYSGRTVCHWDGKVYVSSVVNAEAHYTQRLTSGFPRRRTSHIVGHVAAPGLTSSYHLRTSLGWGSRWCSGEVSSPPMPGNTGPP